MNSALFIRRRSVLALWIVAPLAAIAGILALSRGVQEHERSTLLRDRELSGLIPDMEAALVAFDRFAADYKLNSKTSLPMQDRYIALFNEAAEYTQFTITAINLKQDPPDKTPIGTVRISVFVKGNGTEKGIAAFLSNLKARDKRLVENQITITSDRSQSYLEAEFGRVYLAEEKGHENIL